MASKALRGLIYIPPKIGLWDNYRTEALYCIDEGGVYYIDCETY